MISTSAGQGPGEPIEAFVETVARGGAGGLNIPLPVAEVVQAQLLGDLGNGHRVRKVLLVGKDEQHSIAHLVLAQYFGQLLSGVLAAITVVAVNHIDEAIGPLVV